MQYSFVSTILEERNKTYLKIPFNVWETCGQKGLIPVKVKIKDKTFECKLLPKGNGIYYIPINKKIKSVLDCATEIQAQFEVVDQLSRINTNSPYNKENPIRIIDSIGYLRQPQSGLCGQTCLAMLAGIPVEEVIKIMKSKRWQASISKVIETLDYFGFTYDELSSQVRHFM